MTRKFLVPLLATVVAVAVAVPVLAASQSSVTPTVHLSKRAMKMSRTALRTARQAKRQARQAAATANGAAGAAAAAQAAVAATHVQSASVTGAASTESESFVQLAGGPSVSVAVPASGLIEVWAQATIENEGSVSLFEDGHQLAGQAQLCGPEGGAGVLFALEASTPEPIAIATPAAASGAICGSLGAPAPVLFQTTAGQHTYELRYANCSCGGSTSAGFSDRRLFVAPRP